MMEDTLHRSRLPDRLALALNDAAMGLKVRNPTYRSAADISDQVAGKDLKLAVDASLLIPKGERRGRYYLASPTLLEMRNAVREPKEVPDPFVDDSRRAEQEPLL
jgi:hypothetical protein